MYFLLLLLWVCFFFIFFLFSWIENLQWSLVSNLFFQANIYILLSVLACLLVYKQSFFKDTSLDKWDDDTFVFTRFLPSSINIKEFFIDFFSNYVYYIAGVLFYSAIYLITKWFFPNLDIAYIFLVFNTIVLILYVFLKKFSLGKDLVVINLVLISIYYIWEHLFYLFWFLQLFSWIDIINIFAVFILFSITLFDEWYHKYRKIIEQYFIIFFFLELSTLYKWYFSSNITSLGIIAWILGIILLVFTDEIKKYFIISKHASRTWGLIFSGISVVIYCISLWLLSYEFFIYSLWVFCICVLMLLFHKRFCSYFWLSVWAIWIIWVSYFLYTQFLQNLYQDNYVYLVYFILSIVFIYILKKIQTPYEFDRYFFRIISILVNIIWVITFLFFAEISILNVWLLLLWESVYLFFIYYSLRKNNF